MRADALVYEVHRIPSEKGEIETMPGRSYDEIVLVDPPSSRPPPYLLPAALRHHFFRIQLACPANCHVRDYTIRLLHANDEEP